MEMFGSLLQNIDADDIIVDSNFFRALVSRYYLALESRYYLVDLSYKTQNDFL